MKAKRMPKIKMHLVGLVNGRLLPITITGRPDVRGEETVYLNCGFIDQEVCACDLAGFLLALDDLDKANKKLDRRINKKFKK